MIARRADAIEVARLAARTAVVPTPPAQPDGSRIALPDAQRVKRVLVADVIGWTAYEMGLVAGEIIGRSREVRYGRARWVIAWVAYHAMRRSHTQIGEALGGRDRTSVAALRCRADDQVGRDPALRRVRDALLARLAEAAR